MKLLAVELCAFRNAEAVLVEPHPRFNVLAGDNGQGKTNFLEAVYLVGTLRSFRAGRLEELVRFGAPSARVSARVERDGSFGSVVRRYDVEVWSEPARKLARVDGKAVRASADYFGGFNVVLFVPDDLRLPRGSPSARRRFLDRAVWNVEPGFLQEAQDYERILKSRNAVLRPDARAPRASGGGSVSPAQVEELLAVYDEQLAAAGAIIAARRRRYLGELAPRLAAAFERISRSGLAVEARYESDLDEPDPTPGQVAGQKPGQTAGQTAGALLAALKRSRARDRALGYTTAGPHTDDITFLLDGKPARLYASQGQLRALVLALKVAEIAHLGDALGDAPVLLLDDVSSELDPARNRFLFEFLGEVSGQVFITTTDPRHVLLAGAERRDFQVRGGRIELANPPPGEAASR